MKKTIHLTMNRSKGLTGLLLLVLSIILVPSALASTSTQAHPLIMKAAAEKPAAAVNVIVQKTVTDTSIEERVVRLGGSVTKDLSIINAFAAELPAQAALEIAKTPGVRWVSLDAPVVQTACTPPCIDTSKLKSIYPQAVNASKVWNLTSYLQGQGIGVAVVDSGINATHPDLLNESGASRVVASVKFNSKATTTDDYFGHGTHVAGIIGGNGKASGGAYIGIAPRVNLVNVKISDDQGNATESDLIAGLQWVYQNRTKYNIRVVNLSLNTLTNQSYKTSPIDVACEVLWLSRIVVVVASGNVGRNSLYPPANDPFVITVGASDDKGTVDSTDDTLTTYSTYGTTIDNFSKPDLGAPGNNIISLLSRSDNVLATAHPDHLVTGFTGSNQYYRLSGTSMSAPMVAAAAALVLQSNPALTPDQVKYRLVATASRLKAKVPNLSTSATKSAYTEILGSGQLNVDAAVTGKTTQSANTGLAISKILTPSANTARWTSLNWDSLNWDSLNWDSLNWDSLNWDSLNWDSVYWGD